MARVEIYHLNSGGSQEVKATCHLREDTVVCEGDARLVEHLKQGILDRSVRPPERIYPTQGRRFLRSLQDHFNSGYLTASEILNNGDQHPSD